MKQRHMISSQLKSKLLVTSSKKRPICGCWLFSGLLTDKRFLLPALKSQYRQSLNWLSTGNRRIVECVLERTPATLSSFAWAAQSAGPGRLCDILKDTHRLVCSSLFLFKSNYDEIASPRVTCYLYRVCVPWRIRPSAGVQVHVGHREILWHQV